MTWDDKHQFHVFDLWLWSCLLWMHDNGVIQLQNKPLLVRGGWQGDFLGDSRIFCGFDFWVSDNRSHGW